MSGRKDVESLQVAVEQCRRHEQYIPLAEEIVKKVEAAASDANHLDLLPVAFNIGNTIDGILSEQEARLKRDRFLELFRGLPWQERAAMLRESLDDAELKGAMEEERQYLLRRQTKAGIIDKIGEEGATSLCVSLEQVPPGSNMEVSLYARSDYDDALDPADVVHNFAHQRYLRARKVEGNRFQVSEDWYKPDTIPYPELQPHQTVELGSGAGSNVQPYVMYGSALNCDGQYLGLTDRFADHDLVVGQVLLDRVEVLGTNIVDPR